jgi:ABC-2 type transport system permease protein
MTAVDPTPVAAVRVPAAGLRHQIRAAAVVWRREMIRFGRDRSRIVSSPWLPWSGCPTTW